MALLAGRRRFILPILFFVALFYPTITYRCVVPASHLLCPSLIGLSRYEIQNTLTSASRPLWGSPTGPRQVLAHYHSNGLWATDDICLLHGFKPRPVVEIIEREMWDAFILDNPTNAELDLLEIRLHELYEVVDRVFIVESNRKLENACPLVSVNTSLGTINGTPKPFYFGEKRFDERFWQSQHKFVYKAVPAPPIDSLRSPEPEVWEARMRRELNQLIRTRSSNTVKSPIVMFSAVDEVPAGHTLRLLRDCTWPSPMHLQMRRFMYSYEWPVGMGSWRTQVHVWDEATAPPLEEKYEIIATGKKGEENSGEKAGDMQKTAVEIGEARKVKTEYSRDMVSDIVLADAGWHCSYCYRNLEDLSAKLEGEKGLICAYQYTEECFR